MYVCVMCVVCVCVGVGVGVGVRVVLTFRPFALGPFALRPSLLLMDNKYHMPHVCTG